MNTELIDNNFQRKKLFCFGLKVILNPPDKFLNFCSNRTIVKFFLQIVNRPTFTTPLTRRFLSFEG